MTTVGRVALCAAALAAGALLPSEAAPSLAAASSAPPRLVLIATNGSLAEVDTLDPSTGSTTRVAGNTSNRPMVTAAWNAATGQVYFTEPSLQGEGSLAGHGYVIAQDGAGAAKEVAPAVDMDVSPDGQRLVWSEGAGTSFAGHVRYVGGGSMTSLGSNVLEPRFSADGTRLVLVKILPARTASGQQESIFTVAPDGTGLRRVTAAGPRDEEPSFGPDGRRILFTRYDATGKKPSVYAANTDGTNLRLVARSATHADWAANGWLVYCRANVLVVRSPGVPGQERALPGTQGDCAPRFIR